MGTKTVCAFGLVEAVAKAYEEWDISNHGNINIAYNICKALWWLNNGSTSIETTISRFSRIDNFYYEKYKEDIEKYLVLI